ncbi:MAG: SpoIIE family protein phosphatase [Oscillatoria princeps RMCB-10]|nr:SpoIIE family protein phosphatase [Oscillatoria princeps RMCB-10]
MLSFFPASNLVKHATTGELVLQSLHWDGSTGIEILALDRGPGMANVSRCLNDGFSTAGTAGTGLGAIRRLSDVFDIHSSAGTGTALLARLRSRPLSPPAPDLEIGAVCLPKAGEQECGDAWAFSRHQGRNLILVADGLGHGPAAAAASSEAARIFQQSAGLPLEEIAKAAHAALRPTRGAALAIAEVSPNLQAVRFVGVGNIAGAIVTAQGSRSLVSYNGTIGYEITKIKEFVFPWPQNALLVMHSDGLATQWRLDRYAGLAAKHPSLIAGVLYRDFKRGRDDVTVLIAREGKLLP